MMEFEQIHALADGELGGQEQAEVIERIGRCEKTRAQYETAILLKQTLKTKCGPVECRDAWKTCRSRLDEIDRAKRAERFVGKYAWAICGIFLLSIIGAGTLNHFGRGRALYAGDVSSIVSGLTPVSVQPQGIRNWIASKLGQDVVAIPQTERMDVCGVALGERDGRRFVRVDLKDTRGRMALIAVSDTSALAGSSETGSRAFSHRQIESLNCVSWTQGECALLLVGDRSPSELESAAARIRLDATPR